MNNTRLLFAIPAIVCGVILYGALPYFLIDKRINSEMIDSPIDIFFLALMLIGCGTAMITLGMIAVKKKLAEKGPTLPIGIGGCFAFAFSMYYFIITFPIL